MRETFFTAMKEVMLIAKSMYFIQKNLKTYMSLGKNLTRPLGCIPITCSNMPKFMVLDGKKITGLSNFRSEKDLEIILLDYLFF